MRRPASVTIPVALAFAQLHLARVAAAAGMQCYQAMLRARAEGELALDRCKTHSWHGWHRHMGLRMAALLPFPTCTTNRVKNGAARITWAATFSLQKRLWLFLRAWKISAFD
jgi:hypothetical protein